MEEGSGGSAARGPHRPDLRRMARILSLREANARVQLLVRQSKAFGIKRWPAIVSGLGNFGMAQTAEMLGVGERVEFRVYEARPTPRPGRTAHRSRVVESPPRFMAWLKAAPGLARGRPGSSAH
jgi:hypothetical protein